MSVDDGRSNGALVVSCRPVGEPLGGGGGPSCKEQLLKVIVVGDYGVGKTAVIRRYTSGKFSSTYKLTIGADFAVKELKWSSQIRVNLQLWDIAGHERFGHLTRVYYKYAVGAVIVFDLSRFATFNSVLKWLSDVREKVQLQNGNPIPVLLLANKCDINGISIPVEIIAKFCKENNLIGWFLTSAKENVNISEAMAFLVNHVFNLKSTEPPLGSISLTNNNMEEEVTVKHTKSKQKCCG